MSKIDETLEGCMSFEGTIGQLTQEKAALQTQNAQLWRLVDKQRAIIQGLQKDLDKATQIAKGERAKTKADTEDESVVPYAGNASSALPYPTTPEHGKLDIMPTAPHVIEDYDDSSTVTDQSPESNSSPRSYNKSSRRPPARLDLQTSRSMNHADFPAKSPLRSGTSSRSFQLDENRENIIRRDGTFTPMSPSLSVRMHQVSRSSSPLTPQLSSPGMRSDEFDRVSVPRRERVRTPSLRSFSGAIPRDGTLSAGQPRQELRAGSSPLDHAVKQLRPHGFIEGDTGAYDVTGSAPDTPATVRSKTPDSVISDARIVESIQPPPQKDHMPHSDSGGTLADIAGTYYSHSSTTLSIAQPFTDEHTSATSCTRTPVSAPNVDPVSSPESVYDDDARMPRVTTLASELPVTSFELEPAAEFLSSPEKSSWLEHSPERPRQYSEISISADSIAPSESVLTTSSYETVVRHVISPEILGSINLYVVSCRPHARMIIGIFRNDMLLIHKVEKPYTAILELAQDLGTGMRLGLPSIEELESTQSPVLSAPKVAVDQWLSAVQAHLQVQPGSRATQAFCTFLSSDYLDETVNGSDPFTNVTMHHNTSNDYSGSYLSATEIARAHSTGKSVKPYKEGYLSKRGKNFGGWKSKYFVLDSPFLRYFESPGGSLVGSIRLSQAQISRQPSANEKDTIDSDIKHAFLILEPKKRNANSYVRHVLCASNDTERDDWIKVLLQYVHVEMPPTELTKADKKLAKEQQKELKKTGKPSTIGSPHGTPVGVSRQVPHVGDAFSAIGYNDTTAGRLPLFDSENQATTSTKLASPEIENQPVSISRPMNGAPIDNNTAWGATSVSSAASAALSTLQPTNAADKRAKKKSFWAFGKGDNNATPSTVRDMASLRSPSYNDISFSSVSNGGTVFGAPLTEAVQASSARNLPTSAPIVLYRCIQYLDLKHAEQEEGIYRLSGSNTVIRGLKDRFNSESDIDLVGSGEYFDIHAVAGLLKLYLRELPSSLLTRDLQRDFLDIIDMPEGAARMITVRTLVHSLPRENFELLKLLSGHLRKIVDNSDVNKMTLRNVGIVFSPTLNIPAGVFSLFIAEYGIIFGPQPGVTQAKSSPAMRSCEFNSSSASSPRSFTQHQGFAATGYSTETQNADYATASETILPRMEFSNYDGHGEI